MHTLSSDYNYVYKSVERTTRWAARCKEAHRNTITSIVWNNPGGIYEELRKKSAGK